MKPTYAHICQGGPLDQIGFNLLHDGKQVIQAGDNRPGQYRRTSRTNPAGQRIWTHEAKTTPSHALR